MFRLNIGSQLKLVPLLVKLKMILFQAIYNNVVTSIALNPNHVVSVSEVADKDGVKYTLITTTMDRWTVIETYPEVVGRLNAF